MLVSLRRAVVEIGRGAYLRAASVGAVVGASVVALAPVAAEAPVITEYTGFVADITGAITTAVPTMLLAVAAPVAGLLAVRLGVGFVRSFIS